MGAGSCHSPWQQKPASPPGAGRLGVPLPSLGGLPSQQGTCLGPFPNTKTAAASAFGRRVGKVGGLPYSSPCFSHPITAHGAGRGEKQIASG